MLFMILFASLKSCKISGFPYSIPIGIILSILLYSFIFGVRYGVGMDFFAYLDTYNIAISKGLNYLRFEPGFLLLVDYCTRFKLHFSIFFAIIALIQISFLLFAFKDKKLLPYIIFALFCLDILSWQNGLRQIISVSIFIFAIKYIRDGFWLKYILFIAVALLFHKSAIILFPVYFILRRNCLNKQWSISLQLIVLLIVVAIGPQVSSISNLIFSKFDFIFNEFDYSEYANYTKISSSSRGVGFLCNLIIICVLISYSNKLKLFFKNDSFYIFYTLSYFGYLFMNLTIGSIILNRPNYYFNGLFFVSVAYLMRYLYLNFRTNTIDKLSFVLVTFLLLSLFLFMVIKGDSTTARYFFFWNDEITSYYFINA